MNVLGVDVDGSTHDEGVRIMCVAGDVGGGRCSRHGGGRRCQVDGCPKGDAGGGMMM